MNTPLSQWNDNMGVIKAMDFWEDKLSLSEGKLNVEKGKGLRAGAGVSAHLESMINPVAKEIFLQMREEKSATQLAAFNLDLETFTLLLWHLQIEADNPSDEKQYFNLYTRADRLQQLVQQLIREVICA